MRVLITGVAGFVGATIALGLRECMSDVELAGIDNFIRPGSETNRLALARVGVRVIHSDVRQASDFETLPVADWVIDAAANPSVLAGVDGRTSSRQVVEHNLGGTVNVLEYCRRHRAGLILLSTSRVYSIAAQASLPLKAEGNAFVLDAASPLPPGVSAAGIDETFSTEPPLSLYGATKRASEQLALEYASAFGFPVWINRCGVLAGAGQFARPDQGIFSYWIHSWAARRPLKYIGFGGLQVRDVLHPRDLVPLLARQMQATDHAPRITGHGLRTTDHGLRTFNVSGGVESAASLRLVSEWCARRFGVHDVISAAETRAFDLAWTILDSSACKERWNWAPATPRDAIFEEIAVHAERHREWLDLSAP
jgi:CDP-paratose 2-epimerase